MIDSVIKTAVPGSKTYKSITNQYLFFKSRGTDRFRKGLSLQWAKRQLAAPAAFDPETLTAEYRACAVRIEKMPGVVEN